MSCHGHPLIAVLEHLLTISQFYCKNCTSHVYHEQEALGPDSIVLRTGLLDEGVKNFKPGAEIFGKDRLSWEKEVAQTFEVMPPS